MNKPKAPKDMSAPEFVEYLEKTRPSMPMAERFVLRTALDEPAPNPFTPDQLAWMREEQRAGFGYAALNSNGLVYSYKTMPRKDKMNLWVSDGKSTSTHAGFLANYLSFSDPEPLCFADYAPMEGAADV